MLGSWVVVTTIVFVVLAGALGLLIGRLLGGGAAQAVTTTGLVSILRFGLLGLIIIGSQLHGDPTYLGPAITFALIDLILPRVLAVRIGHRSPAGSRT